MQGPGNVHQKQTTNIMHEINYRVFGMRNFVSIF